MTGTRAGLRVLPLLIVEDEHGSPAIRCYCGAEPATVRRGVAHQMPGLRAAPPTVNMSADVSDLGVLRMILHAKSCQRGRNLMAEVQAPPDWITGGAA